MKDKIGRGITRSVLYMVKILIRPAELLFVRRYMQIYVWLLRQYGVKFNGTPRFISSRARFDDFELVSIGEKVVLSKYVILLTHDYSVTTALIAIGDPPKTDIAVRRPICIGNNVFVGMGTIVLPGTLIGDNVIVGAGSVLRGNIEPDSIMIGNPAVKIGTLSENSDKWLARRDGIGATSDQV